MKKHVDHQKELEKWWMAFGHALTEIGNLGKKQYATILKPLHTACFYTHEALCGRDAFYYDKLKKEYNPDWIGDGLQYKDPPGTFEGIQDTEDMEIYDTHNSTP